MFSYQDWNICKKDIRANILLQTAYFLDWTVLENLKNHGKGKVECWKQFKKKERKKKE